MFVLAELSDNYFQIFKLSVSCEVDLKLLSQNYKSLLMKSHPDRHQDVVKKRQAIKLTAYINKAYTTLKNLDSRAIYLLEISDYSKNPEHETIKDTNFLAEQLALREDLETIKQQQQPKVKIANIQQKVTADINKHYAQFSEYWYLASKESLKQAKQLAYKLKFLLRVQAELNKLETTMLD